MPENSFNDYNHDYFLEKHKVLLVPSASLIGDSGSEIIKQALTRYVESGGSLVVFSQQYGNDIKSLIPMPEGEIGQVFGFREDSSCLKNSVYFSGMHPVLSSSRTGLLDICVDSYYTVTSNSTATVILQRKVNHEPALLYYKYGQGTVFLTSLFTDYAYSRSMAGTQEINLVINLVRFALDPDATDPHG
jgi:hypothetical protein